MEREVPQREISSGLQAVPTSATDLATADAYILQIVVNNTGASSQTITISDKQGTPRDLLTAVAIDPGVPAVLVFPQGVRMKSGVRWSASGTGLVAEVFGYVAG